jgi:hypothetical protein
MRRFSRSELALWLPVVCNGRDACGGSAREVPNLNSLQVVDANGLKLLKIIKIIKIIQLLKSTKINKN